MKIIREHYINEIILVKNKHVIKVITGVRRCGKSTILEQYKMRLQEKFKIPSRCILQYDFNDPKFAKMTYMELYDDVLSKANKTNINYLFLDEIQEIKQFEKAVIGFFENKMYKFDIYITGSNSKMFSSSLATLFTGRNYEIKVYPFSFREYLLFIDTRKDMQRMSYREIFNKYLTYGGMPIIFNVFDNKSLIKNYIDIFLKDTLNKDVSKRHTIRTLPTFNKFAKYVFEQNGNIFSTHSISNYLRSNNNTHTNHKTIDRYLMWLCEALLLYKVDMFDAKGKKILQTSSKYYCIDVAIKNIQSNFFIKDRGKLLENIVFLELLRRGYEVRVGKLRDGKEIDFIAQKENDPDLIYIQVATTLDTDKIKEREYGNLTSIRDSHKKMVITEDQVNFTDKHGIKTINVIDWLLNDKM